MLPEQYQSFSSIKLLRSQWDTTALCINGLPTATFDRLSIYEKNLGCDYFVNFILWDNRATREVHAAKALSVRNRFLGYRKNGTSILSRPRTEAFSRGYLRSKSQVGELVVSFLRIDDQTVATQIAIISNQQLWFITIGYVEAYKHIAPG